MALAAGTYDLGPHNGRLTIRTGRQGAAAKAGHDLLIEVQTWGATAQIAADPAQSVLELTADSRSLNVLEGTGGIKPLTDKDKTEIAKTIDKEVLKGTPITFRSTAVRPDADDRLHVTGDLELNGASNLISFDLAVADGRLAGEATVTQTNWGIKPYKGLFGALKLADDVVVAIEAQLSSSG